MSETNKDAPLTMTPEQWLGALADAWDQGFKQGGPMHDVNYDDPDAHTRNPYRITSHEGPS